MSSKTQFKPSELDEFKNNGFVIVRSLFNKEEMMYVKNQALNLLNEKPKLGREMVYLEESLKTPGIKQVSRIENFPLILSPAKIRAVLICADGFSIIISSGTSLLVPKVFNGK